MDCRRQDERGVCLSFRLSDTSFVTCGDTFPSEGKAYRKICSQLQGDNYGNSFRAIGERKAKKIPLRRKRLALLPSLPCRQKFDSARVVAFDVLSITISAGYAQDDTLNGSLGIE